MRLVKRGRMTKFFVAVLAGVFVLTSAGLPAFAQGQDQGQGGGGGGQGNPAWLGTNAGLSGGQWALLGLGLAGVTVGVIKATDLLDDDDDGGTPGGGPTPPVHHQGN